MSDSIFTNILQEDAVQAFLNTDEFAERVVYRNSAGMRQIHAIVDRNPPTDIGEVGTAPYLRVIVANSQTKGITPQELDKGADLLEIKARIGDSEYTTYKIRSIEKQDAGMLLLQVR